MSISSYNSTTGELTTYAGSPNVDQVLSASSKNPIANKAVYNALAEKIEKTVNDLVNYYTTSQVYNKAEVRQLIGAISTLSIKVVAALPTTDISATTIYWVGPDATTGKYDQYIYSNNTWVKTGDTSVNLGDYVTTEALELAIADFLTEDDVRTILASYYTKTEIDTLLNSKQDSLTFDNAPTKDSTNVVKSGGVYSAVDDVYKVISRNGAKNLNIYPYHETTETKNGITFTDNGDGSITANGTSTDVAQFFCHLRTNSVTEKNNLIVPNGTYIVSGCPSDINGAAVIVANITENGVSVNKGTDRGNGDTFTVEGDDYYDDQVELGVLIYVYSGKTLDNVTFYPMIRLASDTDSTWQPYIPTNEELSERITDVYKVMGKQGAKNLIPYPYSLDTFTNRDVTFTVNSDGSVDFSGTPNNTNPSYFTIIKPYLLPKGSYILSDGGQADYGGTYLRFYDDEALTTNYSGQYSGLETVSSQIVLNTTSNGGYIQNANCTHKYGYEKKFTIYSDAYVEIQLRSGSSVYPGEYVEGTIYPMLRLASDTDATYQPYTETNYQLTQNKMSYADNSILGVKNLLPNNVASKTLNGVTFTVNNDGSVTINGTATSLTFFYLVGDSVTESGYKLSGRFIVSTQNYISQDSYLRIGKTAGAYTNVTEEKVVSFSENSDIYVVIRIASGEVIDNVTLYPMIRFANDSDATYQPYAKTNQQLTEDKAEQAEVNDIVNIYGAKNLIPYPYSHTTRTVNGITFTDNGDGTVTASGTATDTAVFQLVPYYVETDNVNPKIPTNGEKLILTGCPSGGKVGDTTYFYIQLSESVGSAVWSNNTSDYGEGAKLTPLQNPMSIYVIRIVINKDTVISTPITFKPMLRLASIHDDTWVPYAKTNRELTKKIQNELESRSSLVVIADALTLTKKGNTIKIAFIGNITTTSASLGNLGTITNADFIPDTIWTLPIMDNYSVRIGSDGTLSLKSGPGTYAVVSNTTIIGQALYWKVSNS